MPDRADELQPGPRLLRAVLGALTVTLGLAASVLTSLSTGDAASSGSEAAVGRARISVLSIGLAGLVLTAALSALGRRTSRRSLVALLAIGVAMAASATLVALLLPMPGPTRPVGAKPLALLGLTLALLAWSTALATNRWRVADPAEATRGLGPGRRFLAGLVAVVIAVGAGTGV